ncbi:MAG: gamma carbonic anhydrase family protein [Deltaproteobacteria bacterium]|nr:gamma carbonic anhydrase family protein [Deltaproteobacteria bacterium]
MATSIESVSLIPGPVPNAARLDAQLLELRALYPRAIIDRYLEKLPTLGQRVLIAPGAAVVAEVYLGDDVSVWFGAVLRGDLAPVRVGARSNIQDGAVLHVGDFSPCQVDEDVVVGHRAMLHGCHVERGCLIGMQATVLDDAVVGHGSVVGAGAVVPPKSIIPPRSLVLGVPGKVVRTLTETDEAMAVGLAAKYARLKENYLRDALSRG